jgi:hypothetical protein
LAICNFSRHISAKFCAEIDKNHYICSVELKKSMMMTEQNTFKHYDSPEQYAEAFQQMIDARERWREQVRKQENRLQQG